MQNLGSWDLLLLAGGVLVAVRSLVSMMRARRDRLIAEIRHQVQVEQAKQAAEAAAKKKAASAA